jgi:hypothetical protein
MNIIADHRKFERVVGVSSSAIPEKYRLLERLRKIFLITALQLHWRDISNR